MLLLHFTSNVSGSCHFPEVLRLALSTHCASTSASTSTTAATVTASATDGSASADGITDSTAPDCTTALKSSTLQLAIQLCSAIQRKDCYAFFKLVRLASEGVQRAHPVTHTYTTRTVDGQRVTSCETVTEVNTTSATATAITTTAPSSAEIVTATTKAAALTAPSIEGRQVDICHTSDTTAPTVCALMLCLIQPCLLPLRLYTMQCLLKAYTKAAELPYEFVMNLLLLPTIPALLEFITQECKMDYNRTNRTVVLSIVLAPTGGSGVSGDSKGSEQLIGATSAAGAKATAVSTTTTAAMKQKINVEQLLAKGPAGRAELASTIKNILEPSQPAATNSTNNSNASSHSSSASYLITQIESVDRYIESNTYSVMCQAKTD